MCNRGLHGGGAVTDATPATMTSLEQCQPLWVTMHADAADEWCDDSRCVSAGCLRGGSVTRADSSPMISQETRRRDVTGAMLSRDVQLFEKVAAGRSLKVVWDGQIISA